MIKPRVKQVTYESKYIMTTQKGQKLKEYQLGRDLRVSAREFMHFAGNSAEGLGSRIEDCWGYISIYENISKNHGIFPLKVVATLLNGSRKVTVGA